MKYGKGEPILIEKVSNGFIVSPEKMDGLSRLNDIHVFETIDKLSAFLKDYFEAEKRMSDQ